jgi:hypothetical protein
MRRFWQALCVIMAVAFGGVAIIATLAAGFWGVLVGLFVLPITAFAAPIYEIVRYGNWWPVLSVYGGGLLATVFGGMAVKFGKP